MSRARRSAAAPHGQSLADFAGTAPDPEEAPPGRAEGEVADGMGAAGGGGLRPGDASMGPGFERITERVFRIDVHAEYVELEQGLKFSKPAYRLEYSELLDALDEATDHARRAHKLLVNGKVALEVFELDVEVVFADMRSQAGTDLQREKEAGQRTKQITDADVRERMAHKFPDEWRSTEERRAKARRMVEHLERLADLWQARRASLDTMVKGARRA